MQGASGNSSRTPRHASRQACLQTAAASCCALPALLLHASCVFVLCHSCLQEELAAKLARLAFANPAAARQLAGPQQQQHQQQHGKQQQQQQRFEPFYPTVMSDICNLADPDEAEHLQQPVSREISHSSLAGRLPGAAARPAQQQPQQLAAGGGASMRPPSRPPIPPQVAAATAAAVVSSAAGPHSKPKLPGRPIQQQLQQQQPLAGAASRLGRAAGLTDAQQLPGSSSPAAGSGDTAGPLRAALLLRGMRAAPGGAKQVGAGDAVPGAAAAGRRPTCPGDARGAVASSGGGAGDAAAAPAHLAAHLQQDQSLASFESFYVDCDLPHVLEPRCAAVEAADMITNNPLYYNTLTASENGCGTVDSARLAPGLQQQLREAGGDGGGAGDGRQQDGVALPEPQQQGARSARGVRAGPGTPTGGGAVAAMVAVFEGRPSSSDHDDTGSQQPDNSRSNSPAPLAYAGDAGVYAAAAAAAGAGDKGAKGFGGGRAAAARPGRVQRECDAPGRD